MKTYLYDYISKIDNLLKNDNIDNIDDIINNHLIKINFFQHERLIHLLVTLFYVIFLIAFIALSYIYNLLIFVVLILIVFLIFYVLHYFKLENGVQYLYNQYDLLQKKRK